MSKHFGHVKDWQNSGGNCCPNCGSANINIGSPEWESACILITNKCHDCKITYQEQYDLSFCSDLKGNYTYYENNS